MCKVQIHLYIFNSLCLWNGANNPQDLIFFGSVPWLVFQENYNVIGPNLYFRRPGVRWYKIRSMNSQSQVQQVQSFWLTVTVPCWRGGDSLKWWSWRLIHPPDLTSLSLARSPMAHGQWPQSPVWAPWLVTGPGLSSAGHQRRGRRRSWSQSRSRCHFNIITDRENFTLLRLHTDAALNIKLF